MNNKEKRAESNSKVEKDKFLLTQDQQKSIRISNDAEIDMYLFPNKVITPVVKVLSPFENSQYLNFKKKNSKEITTTKVNNNKGSQYFK